MVTNELWYSPEYEPDMYEFQLSQENDLREKSINDESDEDIPCDF